MGTWSTSITGNDTAMDLRIEYQIAFHYNEVESALLKIEDYIKKEGFDPSDEIEWCAYYYSLADFMWSKGILTEKVKEEALHLIDSGFGLSDWEESGAKILEKRKKVLEKFRDKLTSPQPPRKKIKVDLHTQPIFEIGDVIALQLKTLGKHFYEPPKESGREYTVSEEEFRGLNDKYIVIRKIADHIGFASGVDPNIRDIWPIFQLYQGVFEQVPDLEEVTPFKVATYNDERAFLCPGSMFHFKKRKYVILSNLSGNLEEPAGTGQVDLGNNYHEISLVDAIFSRKTMGVRGLLLCEMRYSNCFSTESRLSGWIFRYRDELIKDMYYHNFTLFLEAYSEKELYRLINEEISVRKEEGADFCNIVSYVKLSDDSIKDFEIKPDVTVSGFYEFDKNKISQMQERDDCVISIVNNEEIFKDALLLDLKEDEETLGVDFCTRRITRRREVYFGNKNFSSKDNPYSYYYLNCFIIYHNGEPVGKCDLFMQRGWAKIEDFHVVSDKRRQGYGTTLLKHVLNVALSKNMHPTIYLVTDEEDTAKEMYQKVGFFKVGERMDLLFKW